MSACEQCWRESGGDPDRYAELLKTSECTPEEQAGGCDAEFCPDCAYKTVHLYTGQCMRAECDYKRKKGKQMKTDMHKNSLSTYAAIADLLPLSRRRVFAAIWDRAPITRQDLSSRFCIPINSVCGRVKELLEAGIIEESGSVVSDSGKPRALLVVADK